MLLPAVVLRGQTQWLRRPLAFVPADSVQLLSYIGPDYRRMVLSRDSSVTAPVFAITPEMERRRDEIATLCRQLTEHLNIVGGGDDERTVPQGLPARMGIAANAYMLLLTGRASHADIIERALLNASVQTAGRSSLPFRQRDRHASFESLLALPGLMYAQQDDDLYVNLYTNSMARIHLPAASFSLDQITLMPVDGTVKLRFSRLAAPTRIRLHLRIPDWVCALLPQPLPFAYARAPQPMPRIFVSGHELYDVTTEGGYVVIDRTWQSLDEVYLTFPIVPQLVRRTQGDRAVRGEVAVQVGPLVYAAQSLPADCYFSANAPLAFTGAESEAGYPVLRGQVFLPAPADAEADSIGFIAVPFCEQTDGVGTVWLPECR